MSHAEYFFSKPFPLVAKLAAVLRGIAPVRTAFVRLAALLRGSKTSEAAAVSEFLGDLRGNAGAIPEIVGDIPGIADKIPGIVDDNPDVARTSDSPDVAPNVDADVALAPACSVSSRQQLIRRRWAETGIKMWAGQGALFIQGSAELLPLRPGAANREYDRLEFKLIAGEIVCEGVVLDPPGRRK